MEHKEPTYPAQDPHQKAQDAIDHAREVRENKLSEAGKKRAAPVPHLVADGTLQRCSVCGYSFGPDLGPSREAAFADHVLKAHRPGQTSEDVNQAAARIVRETTDSQK
jgi:hypothetical protein